MEKLNQIIEAMALAQFQSDTRGSEKRNAFILNHATLGEFVKYFTSRKSSEQGYPWHEQYSDTLMGGLQGLAESFCKEVLWVRMKDKYIEDAVKNLENKVEQSFRVTIESI
jgi:hypothetical protein